MVGFIKNLFSSKSNNNESNEEQPKQQRQKAFFLDPDEAKTYGDIDYMRQPNTSKKSFPKTLKNPEGQERVEQISASEKKSLSNKNSNQSNNNQQSQFSPEPTPGNASSSVQNDPAIEQRRKSDSSLDMFRNMARDMKKE